MNYNTFSELREAANGYLWLLQNCEFGHDEQTDEIVICFHKIISNINFNEIREKLEKGNVNQLAIIERLVEPILNILEKLIDIIGGNMPRIKSNVDPDVGTVFRFCKDIDTILRNEYENLKSRRNSDPTFADEDAVEKLQLLGSGSYGDMALDDFVKEYIIKGLSHIAVVRRIKYMISQCTDEHIQWELRKFLYWRKCDEDVIAELHDAFCDFCRFYDYATDVSHIPSDGNRDDVVARMFGVMEWCKQHDNELKTRLVNRSLLKDVEDLGALATHICESADNWCSAIGNDASTLGLINDVAIILDNAIAPTIKQRTSTSTLVPELHPLPSIRSTAKENATTNVVIAKVDVERLGSFFNAKFKGRGENYNYFDNLVYDIQQIKVAKELAMIAALIYDCKSFVRKPSTFAAWLREFFEIIGRECPKDTRKSKYESTERLKRLFYYLE